MPKKNFPRLVAHGKKSAVSDGFCIKTESLSQPAHFQ